MSWLKRILRTDRGPEPADAASGPATVDASMQRPDAPPKLDVPDGPGARQPLLAASGSVAGFEFEMPSRSHVSGAIGTHGDTGDATAEALAQGARAIGLINAMRPTVESGRIALATLSLSVLERPAVIENLAPGTMIALETGPADAALSPPEQQRIVSEARRAGVRIGVSLAHVASGLPYDFVIARGGDGINAVMVAAQRARLAQPPVTFIATGLASIDEIELALKSGASFASGRVDEMGVQPTRRALQPAVQRICQVLSDLAADADTERIAQNLRADAAVSYRLLRYVNSSALGRRHSIDSIEQAVMLLGRKELYRWLSVLMLAIGEGRRSSRALQEISLSRARLLEILATEQQRDPPDSLFTIGLLSLMDVMMQVPLADALEPLRLSPMAREALLERRGPWHDYLALATDLERRDLKSAIDRSKPFGGLYHVMRRAEEAWQWASGVQAAA